MGDLRLPIPADELARLASHDVPADPDRARMDVSRVEVLDAVDEDGAAVLAVRFTLAVRRPGHVREGWQVTLRFREDLDPEVTPQAFVAIVLANLDEWYFRKDAEPSVAAWGQRVD